MQMLYPHSGRMIFSASSYTATALRVPKGWTPNGFHPLDSRFLFQRRLVRATPVCGLVCAQCRRDLDRRERKGKACDLPRENGFRSTVPELLTLRTIGAALPQVPSETAHTNNFVLSLHSSHHWPIYKCCTDERETRSNVLPHSPARQP